MRLGKMDATANSIVPKRYEVKGYPTLLYYRKNKHQKYKAGRSAEGFVEFAKIMKKPAVVQVSNLHSLQAINKKRPVAFFLGQPTVKKTTSTSLYKLFEAAAFTLQDQFLHIGFAVYYPKIIFISMICVCSVDNSNSRREFQQIASKPFFS